MKNLLLCFIIFASFSNTSCTSPKIIGLKENNKFIIQGHLLKIKKDWKQILEEQKINTLLTNFTIESGKDSNIPDKIYYMLVGTDKENTIKVANLLQLKNGRFSLSPKTKTTAEEGIIICRGCSSGCGPQRLENRWICAPGCGLNCTKSITVKF